MKVGDHEASSDFELRWDPRTDRTVEEMQRTASTAQELVDMTTEANRLVDRIASLSGQLATLNGNVEQTSRADVEQVQEAIGTTIDELTELDGKVRRPPGSMNYRDYPRTSEEIRGVMFGVLGGQGGPTDGQMTVMNELQGDLTGAQSSVAGDHRRQSRPTERHARRSAGRRGAPGGRQPRRTSFRKALARLTPNLWAVAHVAAAPSFLAGYRDCMIRSTCYATSAARSPNPEKIPAWLVTTAS